MNTTTVVERVVKYTMFSLAILIIGLSLNLAVQQRTEAAASAPTDAPAVSARQIQKQLDCLARNIYWEAASEPFEGKVAVAQVTINRMESGQFPNSVCGVVHQKTTTYNKVVCQFSWLCESNHLVRPIHKPLYAESEEVAKMVLLEGFRLKSVKDALYYHADYVNPRWNKDKVIQIGRHIFYKDKA
jgi:spore germination cell wall hydrolase CwlJ-like protein